MLPADSFVADAGYGLEEPSIKEPVDGGLGNTEGGGGFGDGIGERFGGIGTSRKGKRIHGLSITPDCGRVASART